MLAWRRPPSNSGSHLLQCTTWPIQMATARQKTSGKRPLTSAAMVGKTGAAVAAVAVEAARACG